jgi:hypothetical protein
MSDEQMEPINLDELDGDWIKRGQWDIPAHDVETLRAWIAAQGMTMFFRTLEVYKARRDDGRARRTRRRDQERLAARRPSRSW